MSTGEGKFWRKGALRALGQGMAAASMLMAAQVVSIPAFAFLARPAIFAQVGTITTAPTGWLKFCADNPDECRPVTGPHEVPLTPDLLQQLFSINSYVNHRVKWTGDTEL